MAMTAGIKDHGHRKVFLSQMVPLGADRGLAIVMVGVSATVFVMLVPFAKVSLAPMPAFIPAYQSALFYSDVITAAVIYSQYSIQRTRSLLLLGTAYLFTALAIVPHTLSFPGLFGEAGFIGAGPQTTVWLYMLWHAGFPLMLMVYAFIKQDERPLDAPWLCLAGAIAAAMGVVLSATLLTTAGHTLLPMLLRPDNSYTPTMEGLVVVVWALNFVALFVLMSRRPYNILDLWMMVVLFAWACDVGLSAALNAKRFDLGFYVGRAYGLMAASFVLIMLLVETRGLYVRLARGLADERAAAMNRAEAADRTLHETAETLRAVVDASSLAVLALSPQGNVLLWNKTATRLFGYSPAEVIGQPYPLMPDDPVMRDGQRELFRRALAGAVMGDLAFRCRCKDGTQPDIRGSAAPFYDASGVLRGVAFALEDVTEKNAAERQRQRVFETSLDIILITDTRGDITQVSPSSLKTLGYEPEEMVGRSGVDFLFPEDLESTRNEMRAARRGNATRNFRCRYVHKDGHVVSLIWTGVWSELDRRYFFIGRDVTEREHTEEQLRQSQKMEAVGQLTGGVAHDFNNILMVILANVEELLESDNLSPGQLENIAGSGQRAAQLTKRLLAFSRKQRLVPQSTDLTDLVASIDKLLRRTLGEQIAIEAVLANDLWTTSVDRAQLEAALVNLCVNARDAMPKGGLLLIETKNVELDAHYAAENSGVVPGKYVMLAVSDTGVGMAPDIVAKVFEPFFTTKEVGKGTGLGLSMVYGFIKQSNGHVKIYSEIGRGTTIRLYVPRSYSPAEEAALAPKVPPQGNERILVVEDDRRVRTSVLAQLRSLGYTVTEASGAPAALERLGGGETFDLMLTDVVMPGMDGPRLAKITTERWPGMKVLFMSGYSENAAKGHGEIAPNARVLSKPFRKIDLATRVREALGGA